MQIVRLRVLAFKLDTSLGHRFTSRHQAMGLIPSHV